MCSGQYFHKSKFEQMFAGGKKEQYVVSESLLEFQGPWKIKIKTSDGAFLCKYLCLIQ